MKRLLLALIVMAAPAQAQQVTFSPAPILNCLADAHGSQERRDCVGLGAKACTSGKVTCMTAETHYWTTRMEATLVKLREKAALIDSRIDASKPGGFRLTEDLATMQSNWTVWRENRCAFEAMLRRGTPLTSSAAAWCMMTLTGEQALFLEASERYRTKQEE
jgi:uncharacterized protein YecT (DUF1311 family)